MHRDCLMGFEISIWFFDFEGEVGAICGGTDFDFSDFSFWPGVFRALCEREFFSKICKL